MEPGIEWIRDGARFGELAADWDDLLPDDSMPSDRHRWFAAWWQAFGGRLEVGTAWRDGRLAAVLPLRRSPLGGLHAMANLHTPAFRPLAAGPEPLAAICSAAVRAPGGRLHLIGLPVDDPSLQPLKRAARSSRRLLVQEPQQVSPIVDTSGPFEDWRRLTKPRWTAPLERFRRKVQREHDAVFAIVEPPQHLERQLDRAFELEAAGWKGRSATAIASSPDTTAFYRRMASSFHEAGELRLSEIVLDGRLVAFDLALLHRDRLYSLKTAFDEGFRKRAPGLVLRLSIIERCFELGLAAHELLGDDAEWKRKFSTGDRAHTSFRAYARRPVPALAYAYRGRVRPRLRRAYRAARPYRPGAGRSGPRRR